MKMTIYVYFIDENNLIFEKAVLRPWSFHVPCKKARYILETPVGLMNLKVGEKINPDNLELGKVSQQ